jgi:hypothetical protein
MSGGEWRGNGDDVRIQEVDFTFCDDVRIQEVDFTLCDDVRMHVTGHSLSMFNL